MTLTKPTVYMDSCCFIDLAKSILKIPSTDARAAHVHYCRLFLDAARARHVTVYTSTIAVVECVKVTDESVSGGPTREDEEIKVLFKGMLMSSRSGVTPVMPNPSITDFARDLRWNHSITCKPLDRLHLATALRMKATHFLTTDQKLGDANISKLTSLGLNVTPADSAAHLLPDEYKQLQLPVGSASIPASPPSLARP